MLADPVVLQDQRQACSQLDSFAEEHQQQHDPTASAGQRVMPAPKDPHAHLVEVSLTEDSDDDDEFLPCRPNPVAREGAPVMPPSYKSRLERRPGFGNSRNQQQRRTI